MARKRKKRTGSRAKPKPTAMRHRLIKVTVGVVLLALVVVGAVQLSSCGGAEQKPANSNSQPATSSQPTPQPTVAAAPSPSPSPSASPAQAGREVRTASGLRYVDLVEGTGPSPRTGQQVTVHYTGTFENGRKFDSSKDRGQPYPFRIGLGQVIPGWDEGVMTMKVGGKRKLIVPPKLGYGATGFGQTIPPNATLIFEVELLGVR